MRLLFEILNELRLHGLINIVETSASFVCAVPPAPLSRLRSLS